MYQEPSCELKVAVLEQKVIDLKEIVLKLEDVIERISDANANVVKMLAVHEQRINSNEQNNQSVFDKVLELEAKITSNKEQAVKEVGTLKTDLTKDITTLRNRLIAIGTGFVVIGFVISNSGFFGKLLNEEIHKKNPLTNSAYHAKLI
jgi:chromosome segregation ATPase